MESCLQYRYQAAWAVILEVIRVTFEVNITSTFAFACLFIVFSSSRIHCNCIIYMFYLICTDM